MRNLFFILIFIFFGSDTFAANEYFRSIASGNWNSTSTWEMSTNSGSSWITATLTPTETSGTILIQSPNTVTVTANVNADQITVNNGGTISINNLVALTIFDGSGEDVLINSGGTITGSGKLQTQGSAVILNIRAGSNFNVWLRVISGLTTPFDNVSPYIANLNGPVTVESGAVLSTSIGSHTVRYNNVLTNYGTTMTGSGGTIRIGGDSLINNGTLSGTTIYYDSNTVVSGTGIFSTRNMIVTITGYLSIASNVTFSPVMSLTMNLGSTLNLNAFIFTFNSGSFIMKSDSYVLNSGTFRTQGTVSLIFRSTCYFNCPLKVNTGTSTCYNDLTTNSNVNGTVTVDAGATLSVPAGSYTFLVNNNLTNNGIISGTSVFRFNGSLFVNTGTVNVSTFNVESGSHNASGIGTWNTVFNILTGSNVSLTDNLQLRDINVNSGGSLNLNSYKLVLTGSNPVTASGTVNTSAGTVEYKGTSTQNINAAFSFYKLILNNSSGAILQSNINVSDTLTLTSGDINLNGKIIDLLSTGFLNETTSNLVFGTTGHITTTRNINAPSSLNAGGLGAVVTSSSDLGSTMIKRGHTVQSTLNGGQCILRYYDITPVYNSGLNATLEFKYDDSELNGTNESELSLYKSTDSGINWFVAGGIVNTSLNTITVNSMDAFSRVSASIASAVHASIKLFPEAFLNSSTGMLNSNDTVKIFLRNTVTPFAIEDSAKSVIDSVTLTGNFLFQNAPTGTYYLAAHHRNSIETWSSTGGMLYTKGMSLQYDYTTDSTKAYGNNMRKVNSVWGLISGDIDYTGNINLNDLVDVYNSSSLFSTGYILADVTGDQLVNLNDLVYTYNNSALFSLKITP